MTHAAQHGRQDAFCLLCRLEAVSQLDGLSNKDHAGLVDAESLPRTSGRASQMAFLGYTLPSPSQTAGYS
ncbi:MAG TPA: hypothetical protein ENH56_00605 [Roseobacter sp.]|nr:hypothetical protein [Roseobacter sp.]HEC71562.1 hypothetical protein [Roseobacter sp.]